MSTKILIATEIIPEPTLETAVVHNLAVTVMNNQSVRVKLETQSTYQINGIFRY